VEGADPYLATVQARLAADGFAWEENVPWEGSAFRAVAKRSRFAPSRFGFEDRWFLFGEFPAVDQAAVEGYSTSCFEYATKHKLNPLPRGWFRAVTCFGVALAGSVDPAAAEAIRIQQPKKHWAAIVFPAVFDRSTGELHVYEKTPMWGAAYWRGLRRAAQAALTPAATSPEPPAPPPPA
jgi:hypothetical protein